MSGTDALTESRDAAVREDEPSLDTVSAFALALSPEGAELPSEQTATFGSRHPKVNVSAIHLAPAPGRSTVNYSDGMHFVVPTELADEIPDGALVAVGKDTLAYRVKGRRPATQNSDGTVVGMGQGQRADRELLRVDIARVRRGSDEELTEGVAKPSADTPDSPPAEEPPLVDPQEWRSKEQWQHMQQDIRWKDAWPRLTERERAALLAHIELDVLWDRLDDAEREKALEKVQEDRDWPGLRERMETEERERRQAEAKAQRAEAAKATRDRKRRERQQAKEATERAAQAKADREREEREEREAEEQRQRDVEETRERLQRERDELSEGTVVEMA